MLFCVAAKKHFHTNLNKTEMGKFKKQFTFFVVAAVKSDKCKYQ